MHRGTICIGNPIGGQGKSTCAQAAAAAFRLAGAPRKLASADTIEAGGLSKLGKIFRGQVVELGTGAKLADLKANRNLAFAHFDSFGRTLIEGGYIVDIGANVSGPIWEWAVSRQVAKVLRSRNAPLPKLVVPMRAEAQAVEGALDLLERSIALQDIFPFADRILVLNEAGGDFGNYGSSSDFQRLQALKEQSGLKIARMRVCASEVWPIMEREYRPILDLAMMSPEQYETEFHMDAFSASGAHHDLVSWLSETLEEFRRVGLVPLEKTASAAE